MRSVIITGHSQVAVETVPDPVLTGPDGAIVQVERTAICGSDLHFYDGDLPFYPVAPGHEAIGRVVEVGPDVRRFSVGDRVMVSCIAGCGLCRGCAEGDPATCAAGPRIFGAGDLGGAQSELLAVPVADYQLMLGETRLLDPFESHETYRRALSAEQKPAFETEMRRLEGLLSGSASAAAQLGSLSDKPRR